MSVSNAGGSKNGNNRVASLQVALFEFDFDPWLLNEVVRLWEGPVFFRRVVVLNLCSLTDTR